jgi:hypothetical protein
MRHVKQQTSTTKYWASHAVYGGEVFTLRQMFSHVGLLKAGQRLRDITLRIITPDERLSEVPYFRGLAILRQALNIQKGVTRISIFEKEKIGYYAYWTLVSKNGVTNVNSFGVLGSH